MRIGLLGFGTVGKGVYELTKARDDMEVVRVLCRRELTLPDAQVTHDFNDILSDDTIDTVVEAIGGLHPAWDYVKAAIEKGKNVVTANKALVATFYDELIPLVEKMGVHFRCTASVGGGIGWLSELERVRRCEDVKQVGISLEKLDAVCGTKTDAKVAILYDHKNSWAISNASGFINADKRYVKTCLQHYKSFWKRGVDVDVIETGEDLSHYSLVVMPMLYSLDQAQIDRIEQYVAQGGTAVATYATGYVNETDLCYLGGFPGNRLKDVFGLTADEIDTLYPADKNTVLWNGQTYDVIDYCELITPTTAESLGYYGADFYKGMPALLKNSSSPL